eukprot:gene20647-biopygen11616
MVNVLDRGLGGGGRPTPTAPGRSRTGRVWAAFLPQRQPTSTPRDAGRERRSWRAARMHSRALRTPSRASPDSHGHPPLPPTPAHTCLSTSTCSCDVVIISWRWSGIVSSILSGKSGAGFHRLPFGAACSVCHGQMIPGFTRIPRCTPSQFSLFFFVAAADAAAGPP